MADSMFRQWKILLTIPRFPQGIKIPEIIGKLQRQGIELPTYRTIQRDLDGLASVFPQLRNEKRDSACYWYLDTEKTVMEIPQMESPTALAFYLAEQRLQNLLPPSALQQLQPHFNTATNLINKHDTPYANWREKIRVLPQTQQLIPPDIDASVLNTIYTALLDNCRFEGKYFARRDDQYKSYRVNPLALVFRGTVTYLVCTLRDYSDIRLLSLHRFVEATLTDTPRTVPAGFDLDAYIQDGHVDFLIGDNIELELLIDEEVAIHLRESKLTEGQQMTLRDNGLSHFKAYVRDTGQLRWWLWGFAEQIEILKPETLRQEFKQKTAKMTRKYQE
ncbi:MAG: WYL domain-containing protein [Methylobacter sp.]|nr:WYL domain-containing protein [Methylobacter sp.]